MDRILRPKEVSRRIGLSRRQINRMIEDKLFPPSFKLTDSPCKNAAIGWKESEIEEYELARDIRMGA